MTKREYLERKRRHKRIMRIRMAIKIAVYIIVALMVTGLVWAVAKPLVNKLSGGKETEEQQMEVQEEDVTAAVVAGEPADAEATEEADAETNAETSAETSAETNAETSAASVLLGSWNVDDIGWSYTKGDGTVCTSEWHTIDGVEYYFNEQGYMATGWVDFGDDSRYFEADGSEDKEAHQKLVAITYDDGPSAQTERLLDILDAYDVPATFFVVGEQAEYYSDTLKREADMGMEIGSHTYDHTYLYKVSGEEIQETMRKNEEVLESIIGRGSEIMRPTGGGINDTVRANVDMPMVNWDVDTLDWKSRDADSVAQIVREEVRDGSIILMHDLYESTVDASEMIIPELLAQRYKFVTVSDLARRRGVEMQPGVEYKAFYPEETTEE